MRIKFNGENLYVKLHINLIHKILLLFFFFFLFNLAMEHALGFPLYIMFLSKIHVI